MPCFYCGKRVSLVRQLADADFCSDSHRKRYHELTRLALDKLLDANQRLATPELRPEEEPEPVRGWRQPKRASRLPEEIAIAEEPEEDLPAPPPPPRRRAVKEPEPVFSMPAAPEPEEGPPLVDYFAMMEFGPMGMTAAPQGVELALAEPLFTAHTRASAHDHLAAWSGPFAGDRSGATAPHDSVFERAGATSAGFRSARWHGNLPRTSALISAGTDWTLPPQSLILGRVVPTTYASRLEMEVRAMGRAVPRPTLPHAAAGRAGRAGLSPAGIVHYPRLAAGLGRATQRSTRSEAVAFRAWVDAGNLTVGAITNIVRVSGFQPFQVGTVSGPTRQKAAPAALFHLQASLSLQVPVRGPQLPAAAGYADLPSPGATRFEPHALVAQARTFTAGTLLPDPLLEIIAEVEIGETPPLADQWLVPTPDAMAVVSARRPAASAVFRAGAIGLPELPVETQAIGLRTPELEVLGYPPSVRAGLVRMQRVAAELEAWSETETWLPVFDAHGLGCAVPSAASLTVLGSPPSVHRPYAAAEGQALAFAAGAPAVPYTGGIAAARHEIEEASFESTAASVAAGAALPSAVSVGALFRRPEAMVRTPSLPAAPPTPSLSPSLLVHAITQQRPMTAPRAARLAATAGFLFEARTPDFPALFESRLPEGAYLPLGDQAVRKGTRLLEAERLAFPAAPVPVPELQARTGAGRLYVAEPATQVPAPFVARMPGTRMHDAAVIRVSSTVRLVPAGTKALCGPRVIEPPSLEEYPQPAARALPTPARAASAQEMVRQTLLPPAPAPFGAAHVLPWPEEAVIVPRVARPMFPAARAAVQALPAPPTALPERAVTTVTPLMLPVPAAISSQVAGLRTRGYPLPSGWIAPDPAAPVVTAGSALAREGQLKSAPLDRGAYLEPSRRAPASASVQGTGTPFVAQAPLLPPEYGVAAREALDHSPAAPIPPTSKTGKAPLASLISMGFRLRHALLPEIRVEPALARIGAARRLEECECEPLASPALRDVLRTRVASTTAVAVPISEPLGRGAGAIRPIRPFALAEAGMGPLPKQGTRTISSRRRDVEQIGFPVATPAEPASKALQARRQLDFALPAALSGRSVAGLSKSAAASVVAVSTQAAELPGAAPLVLAHPLATIPPSVVQLRTLDRARSRAVAGWEALGRESSTAGFRSIRSGIDGARWPAAAGLRFAHGPEWPAKKGQAKKIDPRLAVEFAVPVAREPQSAGYVPSLGNSPAAKTPAPPVRQDAHTQSKKALLAPIFRMVRHASRLPVFHALVDKAHMPFGVFHIVDIEDWDDANATKIGPPCPAPLLEPRAPVARFTEHPRHTLEMRPPAPVLGEPYAGAHLATRTCGERPFALELLLVDGAVGLLKLDLTTMAEGYEPRWRSALKTASGLFRSVVLLIPCAIVMSAMLAGCSARGGSLRENIQNRAAMYMEHDFSKGLEGWVGGPDWAKSWTQDAAGFVYAGQLALYRPSLSLSNYRMEFLGQIDGGSIGWVYRAADLQNYYATKLMVIKPGPPPQLALVRYEVVAGQETERVQVPVRMLIHNGRPYRIQQDVVGAGFTTSIEGEVIDFWSDDRLRAGGVGFLGDTGNRPHIYWMKLSNNDDFWGKLCGSLAPNK